VSDEDPKRARSENDLKARGAEEQDVGDPELVQPEVMKRRSE
jgi:hypothetical protein